MGPYFQRSNASDIETEETNWTSLKIKLEIDLIDFRTRLMMLFIICKLARQIMFKLGNAPTRPRSPG